MSTVIFKWNPAFSSSPMIGYLDNLYRICHGEKVQFDWSVWDYDKIQEGDRYYWVKLGYGQTGIVSSGKIIKAPYQGEDWSGKGRVTYYVDYEPDVMINPDTLPILTSKELTTEIPDFDWYKGHSGIVLNEQQAANLEILWHKFIERNSGFWQKALEARYNDQLWMKTNP